MHFKITFFLSALATLALGSKKAELTKIKLTSVDPLAVCNDGSPAVYYWKKSSNPSNNKWLVFLEGGGQCYDKKSCQKR